MVLWAVQSLGMEEQGRCPQLDLQRAPPRGQQEVNGQLVDTDAHISDPEVFFIPLLLLPTLSQIQRTFGQANEGILQNFGLPSQVMAC